MAKRLIFLLSAAILSLLLNAFFITQFFAMRFEIAQIRHECQGKANGNILSFGKLFVDKVLLGQGTVSFDDRLKLENSVRDIKNEQIFAQWQKFTNSANDQEAQQNAGLLFQMLLDNMAN